MLSQTKKGHRYVIEYVTIFVYRSESSNIRDVSRKLEYLDEIREYVFIDWQL